MTTTYTIVHGTDESVWFFEDTADEHRYHILKTVTDEAGNLVSQEVVASVDTYALAVVALAKFKM
jgi:hypothetical protein